MIDLRIVIALELGVVVTGVALTLWWIKRSVRRLIKQMEEADNRNCR